MNYSNIKYYDIANGTGVRASLFVSGCRRRCKGCFNSEAWEFGSGMPFTEDVEDGIIEWLKLPHASGLSILGGEPLEPENVPDLERLLLRVHIECPDRDVWMWTGNRYEDVAGLPILQYVDVLVDGEFVDGLRDITLRFRGSSNQRVIDLDKTRRRGEVVPWSDGRILSTHRWVEDA